jgi:VanZ family protein
MKKFLYFLPAILFYLLIFTLSSKDLGIKINGHHLDKIAHMIEFAIMAFLLSLGFFKVLKDSTSTKITVTFFVGLALGILDEFHQHYVPGRNMDVRDALADALGVAGGIFLYWYLEKKTKRAIKA